MRRRRLYRLGLVGAIALGGIYAAADVVALQYFESRGSAQIARGMAAEEASIDLGTFPFLPSYLRGRLSSVEVSARGATASGLRIDRLDVTFSHARYSPRRMLSLARSRHATRTPVSGQEPLGRVEVNQWDLEEFLKLRDRSLAELRILATGIEMIFETAEGERLPPARFLPQIDDRRLLLRLVGTAGLPPTMADAARRLQEAIDIPAIPEGLRTDVRLGNGSFVLEAAGSEFEIMVGEGTE